jgi:predicted TPR repeat methyltransferase
MSQAKVSHFDQAAATWDDNPMRIALMRAVGEAILREARPTKNMDVLDYGCGTGLVGTAALCCEAKLSGLEGSPWRSSGAAAGSAGQYRLERVFRSGIARR